MPTSVKTPLPLRTTRPAAEPFRTAEEAWFWTMRTLRARHEGARSHGSSAPRPCEPDDIITCLDNLHRQRRITLDHARVLGLWGNRQMPPTHTQITPHDPLIWQEALTLLADPLRKKGIISN